MFCLQVLAETLLSYSMLTSMEAQPLFTGFQVYSKKAMFTIKIYISHLRAPDQPGMLRITGICPYIALYMVVLGCFAWLQGGMTRYNHAFWYIGGIGWYYLLLPLIQYALYIAMLALYIQYAHHHLLLHLSHLASVGLSRPGIFFIQVESIYKDKKKISYILII